MSMHFATPRHEQTNFTGRSPKAGSSSRIHAVCQVQKLKRRNQAQPVWRKVRSSYGRSSTRTSLSTRTGLSQADRTVLLRQQGLLKAQQGHYEAAIALLSQLIEQNGENASDYNNRGLIYFQSGQLAAAIADYNHALHLNPTLDSAYNNRANYYAAQGQFLEAIADYDMALDLNPTNSRAWINQGITFRDLQLYDRAIESFDRAVHLNRLEGHIYAERGRAYHLKGDWNCAIADYQKALEILPALSEFSSEPPAVRLRNRVNTWLGELLGLISF